MSMLRVLHVIPAPTAGGAQRDVLDLLPSLAAAGIDVGAVAIYQSNLAPEHEPGLGESVASIGRRGRRDYSFVPALVRRIRAFRPDVVHTHAHAGKYWGRPAARIAGVRAIVHTEHYPGGLRRTLAEKFLDRICGAFTDRFVLFFPEQGELLARREAISPEKIAFIPNGLTETAVERRGSRAAMRRAQSIPDDRFAIVMIGGLAQHKNHALAFHAIARLEPKLRERIALYVIGAGVRENALRNLSREIGIGACTRFLGYRNDAVELLSGADVLLNTSQSEGMPIALVEAMLANVAIVTTPWLGATSMLDGGNLGFMATGWEPRHVAGALERALTDGGKRARCVALAHRRARTDYTLSRAAGAHVRLYESVVRRGAAT